MRRYLTALSLLLGLLLGINPALALWADPALPPGSTVPLMAVPSLAGDIVGIKIQNTDSGSSMAAGYMTIGHVFRPGDVQAPHFTGTISGSVLTVSAVTSGSGHIAVGQTLYIPNRAGAEITISTLGSGTGGTGTYNLSASLTVSSPTDMWTVDSFVIRISGSSYYVQVDPLATFPDGTLRHAALTFKTPASIAASSSVDGMLAIGAHTGSAIPPASPAPTDTSLLIAGYDATAAFTWHAVGSGSETLHAATCLTTPTILRKMWFTGPAVNQFQVACYAKGGTGNNLLRVEWNISAYADGKTKTDVSFDNSWFLVGGKSTSLNYDMTLSDGFSATAIPHILYGAWHHVINSSGVIVPNVQFDIPYWIETGALPKFDLSYGVSSLAITGSAGHPAALCLYQCLIDTPSLLHPMDASGTMDTGMGISGGITDDIGVQPNWVAVWMLSQDWRARFTMMANADVAAQWGLRLYDEATNELVDVYQGCVGGVLQGNKYPSVWKGFGYGGTCYGGIDGALLTNTGNAGPTLANGLPPKDPASGPTNGWFYEEDHEPDTSFVPYLITANRIYLKSMQSQANWNIAGEQNGSDVVGFTPSGNCSAACWMSWGKAGWHHTPAAQSLQPRAMAWMTRQIAEAAAYTPDTDPLKASFVGEIDRWGFTAIWGAYVVDDQQGQPDADFQGFGQVRGTIAGVNIGSGGDINNANNFEQVYLRLAFDVVRRMNLGVSKYDNVTTLASMAADLMTFSEHWGGSVGASGDMGFNPFNCCTYWWAQINTRLQNANIPPNPPYFAATFGALYENGQLGNRCFSSPPCAGFNGDLVPEAPWMTGGFNPMNHFISADDGPVISGHQFGQEFTDNTRGSYPFYSAVGSSMTINAHNPTDPGAMIAYRNWAFMRMFANHYWNGRHVGVSIVTNLDANNPGWTMVPYSLHSFKLPDGKYFYDANFVMNDSGGSGITIVPVNSTMDSFLGCVGNGPATINGGTGTFNIYMGCQGTTTINPGVGNAVMMASWNATGITTFNDNIGSNVMYGGSGAGANVFDFETASSGQDTIINFRPGTDTLKVKQNLNANGITTAAGLVSAASVSGNDVVFNLGSGNTVTVKRGYAASNFTTSITMVP